MKNISVLLMMCIMLTSLFVFPAQAKIPPKLRALVMQCEIGREDDLGWKSLGLSIETFISYVRYVYPGMPAKVDMIGADVHMTIGRKTLILVPTEKGRSGASVDQLVAFKLSVLKDPYGLGSRANAVGYAEKIIQQAEQKMRTEKIDLSLSPKERVAILNRRQTAKRREAELLLEQQRLEEAALSMNELSESGLTEVMLEETESLSSALQEKREEALPTEELIEEVSTDEIEIPSAIEIPSEEKKRRWSFGK